jgi:hypothetical protein
MKTIKLFEDYDPSKGAPVATRLLWTKGWKKYMEAHENLGKKLKPLSSMDIPEGIEEKTLIELSNKLIQIADEINKLSL